MHFTSGYSLLWHRYAPVSLSKATNTQMASSDSGFDSGIHGFGRNFNLAISFFISSTTALTAEMRRTVATQIAAEAIANCLQIIMVYGSWMTNITINAPILASKLAHRYEFSSLMFMNHLCGHQRPLASAHGRAPAQHRTKGHYIITEEEEVKGGLTLLNIYSILSSIYIL